MRKVNVIFVVHQKLDVKTKKQDTTIKCSQEQS